MRRRRGAALALALAAAGGGPAAAQPERPLDPYGPDDGPVDPYGAGPAPRPAAPVVAAPGGLVPDPRDPVDPALDEQVAAGLHARGVDRYGAGDYVAAKRLFVESLQRAPGGPTSIESLRMLRTTNQKLGLRDLEDGRPGHVSTEPGPTEPTPVVEPSPSTSTSTSTPDGAWAGEPRPEVVVRDGTEGALAVYAGAAGLAVGLALAGPEGDDGSIGGGAAFAGALGAAAGVAGALWADRRWDPSSGQRTAVVTAGVLGGVAGGALADVVTGEEADGFRTDPDDLYRGAALGTVLGAAGGVLWARAADPSPGDVALVGSLGSYGAGLGLLIGGAMDPPQTEAYTLNAALGAALGAGGGVLLGRTAETTRRRMAWIDLGAAAGAALPWVLIYPLAADDGRDDEQLVSGIACATLALGAAAAWWLTR
jgi:hypothetical protein